MGRVTRRTFLKSTAAATTALLLPDRLTTAAPPPTTQPTPDKYVTCFYQVNTAGLKDLAGPAALPNGDQYLHLITCSHAGHKPHPDFANAVRALGPSFKYARCIDAHKYPDWQHAPADQLRQWAIDFRTECLPAAGPADLFAFNEMPTGAESDPALQRQIATWMRYLHDPKDNRPPLPGVFYFVEENLDPNRWKVTGAADELFAALDATCDLVVGEHYHDKQFVYARTPQQYADHLFALPKWLDATGRPPQQNIARHKYCALHSSYYAPTKTPWEGLQKDTSTPADFRAYLQRVVDCTRLSPYGKSRIAFGPLATRQMDPADVIPPLAAILHTDAANFTAQHPS
jgi:hypothetical protein